MLNPICGVIAEYNPFHQGHAWQLRQIRKELNAHAIVVVMSGSFVQRGEPAIMSAAERAKLAVENGADLVLELPFAYAAASAQLFARGGVALLEKLGIVTHLAFGSECLDGGLLMQAAHILADEPEDFKAGMKSRLDIGKSWAEARQAALQEATGHGEILRQPNTVLGLEYIQALRRMDSAIQPVTLPRIGSKENDFQMCGFPSASAIRSALRKHENWHGYDIVRPIWPEELSPMLRYRFITDPDAFAQVPDMETGLFFRIKDAMEKGMDWESAVSAIATRRYSRARVRRAFIHGLVGYREADAALFRQELPVYARPLAMSHIGQQLLGQMNLPCIGAKIALSGSEIRLMELSRKAYQLYSLLSGGELDQDLRWHLQITDAAPKQWPEPFPADSPHPAVFLPQPHWS